MVAYLKKRHKIFIFLLITFSSLLEAREQPTDMGSAKRRTIQRHCLKHIESAARVDTKVNNTPYSWLPAEEGSLALQEPGLIIQLTKAYRKSDEATVARWQEDVLQGRSTAMNFLERVELATEDLARLIKSKVVSYQNLLTVESDNKTYLKLYQFFVHWLDSVKHPLQKDQTQWSGFDHIAYGKNLNAEKMAREFDESPDKNPADFYEIFRESRASLIYATWVEIFSALSFKDIDFVSIYLGSERAKAWFKGELPDELITLELDAVSFSQREVRVFEVKSSISRRLGEGSNTAARMTQQFERQIEILKRMRKSVRFLRVVSSTGFSDASIGYFTRLAQRSDVRRSNIYIELYGPDGLVELRASLKD